MTTDLAATNSEQVEKDVGAFITDVNRLKQEIGKVIVGNDALVESVLTCLLAGGHGLLEGVPGLGKTMLVRTLAQSLDLGFSRVQFTPDLMPADIIGTNVLLETDGGGKQFQFQRGPIFAHIVLADEVNRATPKTQSALLEAMQERSVTVGKTSYQLEAPFLVLATQNPLEMEGTYPLPEAQLDRFLFKLKLEFPSRDDLHTILERTTSHAEPEAAPVVSRQRVLEMRDVVRQVPVSHSVQDFAIRLLQATHPQERVAPDATRKYVRFGASPRGAQAMLLGAKILALLDGRFSASCSDIRRVVMPALRHRVILNFEGEAEGITTDALLEQILGHVAEEA